MNLKKIEKGIYISVGLASLAKKEIDKHMNTLVREGQLQTKGARAIVSKVVAEAKKEGTKIEKFVIAEIKKEAKKVKPLVKKAIKKEAKKKKVKAKGKSKKKGKK